MRDVKFKIWSVNIEGYESTGNERTVEGDVISVIESYGIGALSEDNVEGNWNKMKDLFNLEKSFNKDKITVKDIAELIINGGRTHSYIYKTISISEDITTEELTEYIGELYLNWTKEDKENGFDFTSYYLSGLTVDN